MSLYFAAKVPPIENLGNSCREVLAWVNFLENLIDFISKIYCSSRNAKLLHFSSSQTKDSVVILAFYWITFSFE